MPKKKPGLGRVFLWAVEMWCLGGRLREQARSHKDTAVPVGAGLLAKNDDAVELTERLVLWVDDIQSPIHGKVRQHDDLRDGQRRTALGAGQVGGEIAGQNTC